LEVVQSAIALDMLEGLEFCWCRGIPIFYNIVTSLFEWKQDLVDELLEPTTHILKHISSREELFKDKVSHSVSLDAF